MSYNQDTINSQLGAAHRPVRKFEARVRVELAACVIDTSEIDRGGVRPDARRGVVGKVTGRNLVAQPCVQFIKPLTKAIGRHGEAAADAG